MKLHSKGLRDFFLFFIYNQDHKVKQDGVCGTDNTHGR
jgi:hypothetical protein